MFHHIENLRKKPVRIRKYILYVTAPVLTLLIASLWFFSGSVGGNREPTPSEQVSAEEVAPTEIFGQDLLKLFSGINLSGVVDSIKGAVGGLFVEQYKQQESSQ